MEMITVSSSNIAAIGYETNKLRVRFHDGAEWEYENVPEQLHQKLMAADSKNGFFRANIRGVYPASRLR